MTQMIARHISMSINNDVLTKVQVWQGFSGSNRLKFHRAPRPPPPRTASFGRLFRKRTPEVEANRNRRAVHFRYSTSVIQELDCTITFRSRLRGLTRALAIDTSSSAGTQ